jgi:hypothetical protein
MSVGGIAFTRGALVGHEAIWIFVGDRYSLRTQLVAFLLLLLLKGEVSVALCVVTL